MVKVTDADIARISGKPWSPNGIHEENQKDIGKAIEPEAEEEQIQHDTTVRNFRITQKHLEDYGFTAECPKCRASLEGGKTDGISHSDVCRIRIEGKMAQDEKVQAVCEKVKETKEEVS